MKRVLKIVDFVLILTGAVTLFSTPERRMYWAVFLAALVLTSVTLWTAVFLTGQHKQFKK